ncbi:response regulator transcription factor [Salinirussus salinus]|uniref:response regulator transcription factor n=1 Tax=Salinirussus salinus TaxID=1198300 RepID=UPI00135CC047|nr:response regulator transcription factor [Salinirussus salinus]
MSESPQATVLVVDDEPEVADVYALRLETEYETRVAYGGEEALEAVDGDIDVVLLDRRMPTLSGDEVLGKLRERGYETRVIMLTAVDPGMDIIDMPFDDYLCKPVEKDDLTAAIGQQLRAKRYDARLSEYMEVTSKLALLEAELSTQEVSENEDLQELSRRADELKAQMDEALEGFEDIDTAFQEIGRHHS